MPFSTTLARPIALTRPVARSVSYRLVMALAGSVGFFFRASMAAVSRAAGALSLTARAAACHSG